jgi:RNA polymerase sigma factor (sigma-70 family)
MCITGKFAAAVLLTIALLLASTSSTANTNVKKQARGPLKRTELKEAERRLSQMGYRTGPVDGVIDDATQQALLAIWRDLPQLRDPARFDAWSYRLLVRACYAEASRSRRWGPNIHLLPVDEPNAADGLSSVVDRDQLERGFRRLSIDHRAVVVLHHYLDLPLAEVADVLGVPAGTVRSRLHHAIRAMRAALEADARPAAQEVAR